MGKQVSRMMGVVFALFLAGCDSPERQAELARREQAEWRQQLADTIIRDTLYIKDPRTGDCFRYVSAMRGPGVSGVACSSVPPNLLIVGRVP